MPRFYQDDSPYPSLCQEGYDRVIMKTVDTDVAVLAVAALHSIPMLKELWVDFGVNKDHRYISANGIAKALGKEKAEALPLFDASRGCDTVSSFNGIGRKKAWETWKVLFSLTKTFQELAKCPDLLSFATDEAERFVLILYSRTSECKFVNEARKKLLASGRQIENIPPQHKMH